MTQPLNSRSFLDDFTDSEEFLFEEIRSMRTSDGVDDPCLAFLTNLTISYKTGTLAARQFATLIGEPVNPYSWRATELDKFHTELVAQFGGEDPRATLTASLAAKMRALAETRDALGPDAFPFVSGEAQ
jgi:hypothetical protein